MNIGRFFLDVRGTINGEPYYDYMSEVKRARLLIPKLIKKDNLDELRISIISSDPINEVEKFGKLLEQRLSGIDKLHFGHHHADCEMMHIGGTIRKDKATKCEQMAENLKVCEHKICYYADDCMLNRKIARVYLQKLFPNILIIIFDPKENALRGLNDEIEEYLQKQ